MDIRTAACFVSTYHDEKTQLIVILDSRVEFHPFFIGDNYGDSRNSVIIRDIGHEA